MTFRASSGVNFQAFVASIPCPIRESLSSHIGREQTIQRTLITYSHRMELSLLSRGEDTHGHCTPGYRKNQD